MAGVTQYNLLGLRKAIFAQSDHAPTNNAEAVARADEFINRAYWQMAEEAPHVFFTTTMEMEIYPDVASGDDDSLVMADNPSAGKDAWVLVTSEAIGSTTTTFATDGLWNGRQIYLYHTDLGRWFPRRIREVWAEDSYYYIALDRPWMDTDTITKWRIEMGAFPLPHNVIEVKNLVDVNSALRRTITIISEGVGEDYEYDPDRLATSTGDVRLAYRREHQALPAPTFAPTVATAQGTWLGPEPAGTFEYCYTLTFGYQDSDVTHPGPKTQDEIFTAALGRRMPLLESPPSATTGVTASNATTETTNVVQLPDMDFVLGFGDSDTRRYGRAGIKKRIWRRRVTSEDDTGSDFTRNIEAPGRFYLIDEVDGHVASWTDDGSKTPDYQTVLQPTHGYQTLQLHPRPNKRTALRLRAVCRPVPLTDEQDYPLVHEDALNVLLYRVLVFANEAKGDYAAANYHMTLYNQGLQTLARRYGSMVPADTPRPIGRARAYRARAKHPWMQKISGE